jgi:hypothetical protein
MSGFNFVCPRCDATVVVETLPVTICPRCEGNLAISDEERGAPEHLPRPLLLTGGMIISLLFGVFSLLLIVSPKVSVELFDYRAEGTAARIIGAVDCATFLAIAFGLWRHQRWSRPLMIAFWVVLLVLSFVPGVGGSCSWFAVAIVLVMAWFFLYVKDSSARYYESLKVTKRRESPTQ